MGMLTAYRKSAIWYQFVDVSNVSVHGRVDVNKPEIEFIHVFIDQRF